MSGSSADCTGFAVVRSEEVTLTDTVISSVWLRLCGSVVGARAATAYPADYLIPTTVPVSKGFLALASSD